MNARVFAIAAVVFLSELASITPATEPVLPRAASDDISKRYVVVGGTLIEREGVYGHIEAMLTSHAAARPLVFRNLGWSGDTVDVRMRPMNFGDFASHVAIQRPTRIFVSYGMIEAFDGVSQVEPFRESLVKTLDQLAATGASITLVTPNPHEDRGPARSEAAARNAALEAYVKAILLVAKERDHAVVDLFHALGASTSGDARLTDNGMHLSDYGYWRAAQAFETELGFSPPTWELSFAEGRFDRERSRGAMVERVSSADDTLLFRATDETLPAEPFTWGDGHAETWRGATRCLRIEGLPPARYALLVDEREIARADASEWAAGVELTAGPEFEQRQRLRAAIIDKNQLFFYRWRAHNAEYIVGRRAGTNTRGDGLGNSGNPRFPAEMRRLEELIAEREVEITRLATPVPHEYRLSRVE